MIQIALMRPSRTASKHVDGLQTGIFGMRGDFQKSRTMRRWSAFSISICAASWLSEAADLAPAHGVRLAVTENGPMPGLPMRAVARWR